MTDGELANRFGYHIPNLARADKHAAIRIELSVLAEKLNQWLPESREKSLAFTHLEQVMFFANAAIARERCDHCLKPWDAGHGPGCPKDPHPDGPQTPART